MRALHARARARWATPTLHLTAHPTRPPPAVSFLYEAVIPLTFASFDRPYMSYGAMQRVALLEALDSEVAGVPPSVRDVEWR